MTRPNGATELQERNSTQGRETWGDTRAGGYTTSREVEDWAQLDFEGVASDMATDSQDRVYLAVRTTQR